MNSRLKLIVAASVIVLAVGVWFVARSDRNSGTSAEFVRLMNIGKGYVENRDGANAIKTLESAVRLNAESPAARRNLARALLISKEQSDASVAAEHLSKALSIEPDSPATHYLLGLACNRMEQYARAVPYFETAVRIDPVTPALKYQLGRALEHDNQLDRAREQFLETVRLDPLHRYAHHRLAAHGRRRRAREEIETHIRHFERIKALLGPEPEEILERCAYTQPETAAADLQTRSAAKTNDVSFASIPVRWVDVSADVFRSDGDRAAASASVLDVDEDGRPTFVVATPRGELGLLSMTAEGTFDRTTVVPPSSAVGDYHQCLVGDFHLEVTDQHKFVPRHESLNDVILLGVNDLRVFKRTGLDAFEDITAESGLAGLGGNRVSWVDYEHDGDLDLMIARDSGLELWQNNGFAQNANLLVETTQLATSSAKEAPRFENVTERVGITDTGPTFDVMAVELDANVAIDIVAACGASPSRVFMNQRAGRFEPMPEPPGPWPMARWIVANDLDNDGYGDVVLVAETSARIVYGGRAETRTLEFAPGAPGSCAGAVLIDFDNDGLLDICAFGADAQEPAIGRLQLWRNDGPGGWTDATAATGLNALSLPSVTDLVAADFDNDGDTDLLATTADNVLHALRNDGGNANRQLKIRLVSILTNPTGIGTQIELRRQDTWIVRTVSHVPIEIGIGQADRFDTLRALWANGVVDNEFLVPFDARPLTLVEKMVELGSCPFLFAWDGVRFRFVTDLLGNAPLGLTLSRDVILPADPTEYVLVGGAENFSPRDGRYLLEIAECYREVLYLDSARLVAVDHPADVEIHPTDKLMPPPFPESALWALGEAKQPLRIMGDDGIDRTEAVRAIDGVFAPPGVSLPPPLRGMCHPLTLTMDFGPIDREKPLVLALTGWLQYGSASVNVAISQNRGLSVIPPRLEAETADGEWIPVDVVVGMPAGKTKTIVCDLSGRLPPATRRLRLTTTFEIRWDRIALLERRALDSTSVHAVKPSGAELYWKGFPGMGRRGDDHPLTPDYETVHQRPQWRTTPQGWCTRYGDVLELVQRRDEKLAILNGGDAVTLSFDAVDFPPLAAGLTRTFFFHSVGWEKDGDHNVVHGDTVEPLPVDTPLDAGGGEDWQIRYNTRFVRRDAFGRDR